MMMTDDSSAREGLIGDTRKNRTRETNKNMLKKNKQSEVYQPGDNTANH